MSKIRFSLLVVSFVFLGCFSSFAQTDKFIGDWYFASSIYDLNGNLVHTKVIYRIKGNQSEGYTIRSKCVSVEDNKTIYYSDHEFVSSNENELVFMDRVADVRIYYCFKPNGESATIRWLKSYFSESKEWNYSSVDEIRHQLYRVDDF